MISHIGGRVTTFSVAFGLLKGSNGILIESLVNCLISDNIVIDLTGGDSKFLGVFLISEVFSSIRLEVDNIIIELVFLFNGVVLFMMHFSFLFLFILRLYLSIFLLIIKSRENDIVVTVFILGFHDTS